MELGPQIRRETPPSGDRTTHTPATRPSTRSSSCRAGLSRSASPLIPRCDDGPRPNGAECDGGCVHPTHPSTAATSARRRIATSVAGVLLQLRALNLTIRDRVQLVLADVERLPHGEHELSRAARTHGVLTADVETALLFHGQLYAALLPDGIEQSLTRRQHVCE